MNEEEYERTSRDYLNNWRSTQARVSELEAENPELKTKINELICAIELMTKRRIERLVSRDE